MARPASLQKKSRLTLELAAPVRERLDELRVRTGAESVTEVIRRAVAFYDAVLTVGASSREVRLVLKDEQGREETLLIPHAII